MIELKHNQLIFRFPQVHPKARGRIDFQRTLRVPDDGRHYPLPAGLGRFHLEHIEDHAEHLPAHWLKRGGIMLPMYQSEALWINFSGSYPIAVKIATGKINAITGELWKNDLSDDPQDYIVLSEQPWLDGYAIERGTVRQFVATALGRGETAEEQLTGKAEFGGVQIIAFPMKADVYKELFEQQSEEDVEYLDIPMFCRKQSDSVAEMGIAPGGKIHQEIYDDDYGLDAWDLTAGVRCFIHTVNSEHWVSLTQKPMPDKPITQTDYQNAGIPWFDYYAEDKRPLPGSQLLAKLKSFGNKDDRSSSIEVGQPFSLKPLISSEQRNQVSDGDF